LVRSSIYPFTFQIAKELRAESKVAKRAHRATGKKVGRPKNAFGASPTTDKLILKNAKAQIEDQASNEITLHKDVARYA
jgi:hypothetical protein